MKMIKYKDFLEECTASIVIFTISDHRIRITHNFQNFSIIFQIHGRILIAGFVNY